MSMNHNSKISLVIPAYNEEKYLGACLESVRKNGIGLFEIIVVNNASSDGTEAIARTFPNVRVIQEPSKGLTKARQRGLEEARGDIIAYIDADTRMPSGWVETVTRAFEEDPRVVSVSGPYIYFDLSPSWRAPVRIYWLFASFTYLLTGYMVVGGNFAARRSALEAIGGFDRSISFYGEDTDIARRLHRVGRVKFTMKLPMPTSARRLHGEGVFATVWRYMTNFFSEVIRRKPFSDDYRDIR